MVSITLRKRMEKASHFFFCLAGKQHLAIFSILQDSNEGGNQLKVGCVDRIRYEREAQNLYLGMVNRVIIGDDAVFVF